MDKNNFELIKCECQKVLPLAYDESLSYYEQVCKLTNKINEVTELINNINHWISSSLPTDLNFVNRYGNLCENTNKFTFYVSSDGDDNNIGTIDKPLKTINKAMIMASKQFKDVRIFILTSGTYDIDWITQTGDLHINTNAENVILNMTRNFINYSSHLNISGSTNGDITINGNGHQFYNDNCLLTLDHVDLNCDFRLYGSTATFTRTIIHNVTILNGMCTINTGCVFKNTVVNRAALFLTNAYVYFSDTWEINLDNNDNHNFIQMFGGQMVCTVTPNTVNEYKYEKNIMNLCVFITSKTTYDKLKTLCNNNDFRSNIISNITIN